MSIEFLFVGSVVLIITALFALLTVRSLFVKDNELDEKIRQAKQRRAELAKNEEEEPCNNTI